MDKKNENAAAPMDWIISDGDSQILIKTESADQEAQKKTKGVKKALQKPPLQAARKLRFRESGGAQKASPYYLREHRPKRIKEDYNSPLYCGQKNDYYGISKSRFQSKKMARCTRGKQIS